MLYSYKQLCHLIDDGVITGQHDNVNSASIDIVLGRRIMVEKQESGTINMLDKKADHLKMIEMDDDDVLFMKNGLYRLSEATRKKLAGRQSLNPPS
jgi:deoxycytidine triphosphate deaminase